MSEKKDLGILISDDLLPRKHILEITEKANQRVGLIRRCFTNITQRNISTLFKTTVRPLLEYASVVWQPHLKKDIDMLQKVQNRCLALCPTPPATESLEERRKCVVSLKHTKSYIMNIIISSELDPSPADILSCCCFCSGKTLVSISSH